MKRLALGLIGVLCFAVSAQADILAKWTFEVSKPANVKTGVVAEEGVFATTSIASHTADAQSDSSGNGSDNSWRGNDWELDDYFEFKTSTTGYSGVSVSWAQVANAGAPRYFSLSYSTDGSNFTPFADYEVKQSTFKVAAFDEGLVFSFDLSGIDALNNWPTVYFRLTNTSTVAVGSEESGTVTSSGSIRVDDFTVQGVMMVIPEPAAGAMILGGVAMLMGKRRDKAR